MDAFFAAVEQRDEPALRGRPVVVGADPKDGKGRGVVSTASYEAREYGIHSAQPISQAYRRCPQAAFLPVDGPKYRRESERIGQILREFTPQVQFVSIDEAYLDVSGSLRLFGGKRRIAERIRACIRERTGLTASLGVAANKLVAKIASDYEKPDGLTVVEPADVESFLAPMSVKRLPGVGPKMQDSLRRIGVQTVGQLARLSRQFLRERFGEWGAELWRKAHGVNDSPVRTGPQEPKSIGHEHTFGEDTDDMEALRATLMRLCERTARRVRKAGKRATTITTKIRFEDFTTLTRQRTLQVAVADAGSIYTSALSNFQSVAAQGRRIRLVGVSCSGLVDAGAASAQVRQSALFEPPTAEPAHGVKRRLSRAEDAVKDRYGEESLRRGTSLGNG